MMRDPELIGDGQAGLDQRELVLKYQRIVLDRLDELSLDGISAIPQIKLRLNDIYVDRTLVPVDQFVTQEIATATNTSGATLVDLIRAPGSQIALLSDIGGGKSMCMRHVARACVAIADAEPMLPTDFTQSWGGALPLPILITAHEVEKALQLLAITPDDQRLLIESHMWHAIEVWFRDQDLGVLLPMIRQELEHGRCLLMIDGFDEILNESAFDAIVAALNQFTLQYPSNRFVVACDSSDVATLARMRGFIAYTPAPLDHGQIDAMIERWYIALAASPHLQLSDSVSAQIVELQGLLHGNALLEELATSPLTLALWILVHAEGFPLPVARGVILRRQGDLLLNGWAHGSLGSGQSLSQALDVGVSFTAAERHAMFEALAFQFSSPELGILPALSRMVIEPILAASLQSFGVTLDHAVEQVLTRLLTWLCRRGVLAAVESDMYTMPHRSLCDYLAVHALASQPDFVDRVATRSDDARWREALPLVAYELAHSATPQVASELSERLMFETAPAGAAGWQALLLAANCLDAIGIEESPSALRVVAQQELMALLGAPSATLAERIQAGTLLGRLGDPRLAQMLPPMAQIAAGAYVLGSKGGYDDEGPQQRVQVPTFAIGIYPVTNQEYAVFLADTSHQPPHYWYDTRFNNMSHPVVGVTWHEAVAYCAWLNTRLDQAGLRAPELVVRLPLEIEWEKAASWDPHRQVKRQYPWGNEWSDARANTVAGRGNWMTTPVGCYPEGVSAYGLHDCIGNVWEWTADIYCSYPGAAAPFEEPGSYTLRGSSCASLATHARCTFRSRLVASYWRYHLGFRIVMGRPLSV
ncbi:MAG: SUMF1/EgtB/PvdO family nonheme iron enzyme [Roseiflexaceae bacterium]